MSVFKCDMNFQFFPKLAAGNDNQDFLVQPAVKS
jgi:hypothetical protein